MSSTMAHIVGLTKRLDEASSRYAKTPPDPRSDQNTRFSDAILNTDILQRDHSRGCSMRKHIEIALDPNPALIAQDAYRHHSPLISGGNFAVSDSSLVHTSEGTSGGSDPYAEQVAKDVAFAFLYCIFKLGLYHGASFKYHLGLAISLHARLCQAAEEDDYEGSVSKLEGHFIGLMVEALQRQIMKTELCNCQDSIYSCVPTADRILSVSDSNPGRLLMTRSSQSMCVG